MGDAAGGRGGGRGMFPNNWSVLIYVEQAVGDAAIGRGGGAVASTHNPSAAILSLSSCEDCDAQCPLLPRPTSSSHTLPTGSPGDRLRGIQRRASGHKSAARWFLHKLQRERRHLIFGTLSVSLVGNILSVSLVGK